MSETAAGDSLQIDVLLALAREQLRAQGWTIGEASDHVPHQPGLYAIHAGESVWAELGIDYRASTPLYVGKAQRSLVGRDLRDHFAVGPDAKARTGSSTVRRSFAALLSRQLDLAGVPRNLLKPERFANFGLEPEADLRLTAWMHSNLTLAAWGAPAGLPAKALTDVETRLIVEWRPPLNIEKNPEASRTLRQARRSMAAQAAAWLPPGD